VIGSFVTAKVIGTEGVDLVVEPLPEVEPAELMEPAASTASSTVALTVDRAELTAPTASSDERTDVRPDARPVARLDAAPGGTPDAPRDLRGTDRAEEVAR
jgi:hypothetical protein